MGNPICARAVEEPQRVERKVFCKHSERCLDVALSRGWANFSCKSCADFDPVERSAREWIEDGSQCADLLSVVFGL